MGPLGVRHPPAIITKNMRCPPQKIKVQQFLWLPLQISSVSKNILKSFHQNNFEVN
jgi:hypothetical protein